MPSGKPRYLNPVSPETSPSKKNALTTAQLRKIIDGTFRDQIASKEFGNSDVAEEFVPPIDTLVEEIIAEISWVQDEFLNSKSVLTKADTVAELKDIFKSLKGAMDRLRSLSDDVVTLFPIDSGPLELADTIEEFVSAAEGPAFVKLKEREKRLRKKEALSWVADEFAIRVLRVAKRYGMKISSTHPNHFPESMSDAVRFLKEFGDRIGLTLSETTWGKRIAKIKKEAPDL